MNAETVFSVLTPTGRGAVAVVTMAGGHATAAAGGFFRAANRRALDKQQIGRIVYGHWADEDLVVCRRDDELLEIHCHGGVQSVATIRRDLASVGCTEISWQEWISRNELCPIRAAAHVALTQAPSTRTAAILLDQYHGALRSELEQIALLLSDANESAVIRLQALLDTAVLGLHLTRPWQVVIAGRPNVGKSSLINALVGFERAIVFDQPGTTRDVVTAMTVIDGWPVELNDTAGLHSTDDELETAGVELARNRLASADLLIWVLDATQVVDPDTVYSDVERQAGEFGLTLATPWLTVVNKIDRAPLQLPRAAIPTCAISERGIEGLLSVIAGTLVPEPPRAGAAVLFSPEQEQAATAALAATQQRNLAEAANWLSRLLGAPPGETQ